MSLLLLRLALLLSLLTVFCSAAHLLPFHYKRAQMDSLQAYQHPDGRRSDNLVPAVEAPVLMSNPVWNVVSRANDLYLSFRRWRRR